MADPSCRDVDNQVLTRPAPARLPWDKLYDDELMFNIVSGGLGGPPVQCELLLAEAPLQYIFAATARRELLDDADCEGHPCRRVRVLLAEGALVFWIDAANGLLRRLDYPTTKLAEQMTKSSACSDVTLSAEFRDARFDAPLDASDFRFTVPDGAQLVQKFIVPPQSLPSELFGRLPGEFFFTDLQGQRLPQAALLGKTCVLVWFNNHPASRTCLEQIAKVQQSLAPGPKWRFTPSAPSPWHCPPPSCRT